MRALFGARIQYSAWTYMKVSRLLATPLTWLERGLTGSTVKPEASSVAVACFARGADGSMDTIHATKLEGSVPLPALLPTLLLLKDALVAAL